MRYTYTHLIPENVAPAGAKRIVVLDEGGKEIGSIPLGRLAPPTGEPLYRFCILSDIHLHPQDSSRTAAFKNAIEYANANEDNAECNFICVCGDLVDNGRGLKYDANNSTHSTWLDNGLGVLAENGTYIDYTPMYADAIKVSNKPVYSIAGNHDAIWGYPTDDRMESYTGYPFYYAVAKTADETNRVYANAAITETDLLIFLGHYGKDHAGGNGDWRGGEQFSAEELAWFEALLAANTDKRRMVFIHPYIPDGAGDPPLTITPPYKPPNLWTKKDSISTDAGADFLSILSQYPGVILFNGHSHYRFRTQEEQSIAIVYKPADDSFASIHVPSCTKLRDVQGGQRVDLTASSEDYGGEGFVVDVYSDCIHLRGRDFINGEWVGIGTYRINT